ncbi:Y-family DNA polymerase [Oceanicella actignis]|uniref:Y-family DNA polymerase n=1 Tax=Oceanicella actignis TaxID=1189325 RepID=UPI0012524E02|nr:protein ImuB [Oceanicella actignis]
MSMIDSPPAPDAPHAPASPAPRGRRILSLWLPHMGAERALRRAGLDADAPFALIAPIGGAATAVSVNAAALALGLRAGMTLADARALHPALAVAWRDPAAEARLLAALLRWAGRFSPWAAIEDGPPGEGGLIADVTGCAHLFGGEAALARLMLRELGARGLTARLAVADTRGGAWALARFGAASPDGAAIAPPGTLRAALATLPAAALRLPEETVRALARLGLRRVGDIAGMPRAALARRFGVELTRRLDQALGAEPEPVSPARPAPVFAVRLTLPEPIGLRADIEAALKRLLERLCARLEAEGRGARRLRLEIRRADGGAQAQELGLAQAMRDPARILPLFDAALARLEAGFGVDAVRLEATMTEPLSARRVRGCLDAQAAAMRRRHGPQAQQDAQAAEAVFADLLGRLGARIGLERLFRLHPGDSHIPERAARLLAAAWSEPHAGGWPPPDAPRPAALLTPEPAQPLAAAEPDAERGGARRAADGGAAGGEGGGGAERPPVRLRWRGRVLELARVSGPERIAPEWWLDDPAWRAGARDYWRVETTAGARLWLFRVLRAPPGQGWFVQGIMP